MANKNPISKIKLPNDTKTYDVKDNTLIAGSNITITNETDGTRSINSSDTKNTAGTTNKASTKMFLVGATTQGDNPQTYSNSNVYIGTDNKLYSNGSVVLTGHQSIKTLNTNNTSAQTASSSEAIAGSGTINLHKVSKTGAYSDLIGTPTIDTTVTQNSSNLITSGAVWTAIDNLPEPMIFKGTLGTGGTITSLPTASSANEGFTYKVITAGTYASQSAKVGDVFVSNGSAWVLIPAGDTDSDTWRAIKVNGTQLLGNGITTGAVNLKSGTNVTVNGSGSDITISATDTTYDDATTSASGLMSASDKTKLNGIASGAEVNVQSDWNVTDNTSDAFIKNKPTIPTIPVTDVQVGGTSVVSNKVANLVTNSTYNATTNKIATMSDLPDTSNFIQKSDTSGLVKNDGTIDTTSYSTLTLGTTATTAAKGNHTHSSLTNGSYKASLPTLTTNSTLALTSDIPSDFDDKYVKYSATQSLSTAQKTTARSNIGAITCGSSTTTQNHIATWSDGFGAGLLDSGYTIAKSVPSNAVFTDTATAADNILDGSNSGTQITYAPYSATTATSTWVSNEANARKIYLGTVNPTREERINLNGYLYSSKVYSGGELVTTNSSSKWNEYYLASNPNGYTSNTGTVTSVRVQAGTGLSSSTSTAQTSTLNTTISVASGYKLPTTTEWNSKSSITANPSSTTGTITSIGIDGTNYALGTSVGVAYNMGTCTSGGSVQNKTVNVGGTFSLTTGVSCIVYFTYANTNTSATLSVNSTTAKTIRLNGSALSSTNKMLNAIYFCRYDGTYWQLYYMQGVSYPYHHHTFIETYYVSGLTLCFHFDWWSSSPNPLTFGGTNNNFISTLKTAYENHRLMHSGYVVNSTKYFSIGYVSFGADYDDDEGYWLDDYMSIMYPSNTTGTTFTELKVTNDNTSVSWYGNDTVIN